MKTAAAAETIELGSVVLLMLAEGSDAEQITSRAGVPADAALAAVTAYASKVLVASPDPCEVDEPTGFCSTHRRVHSNGAWPGE